MKAAWKEGKAMMPEEAVEAALDTYGESNT
jgi:hypothetical protein